MSASGVSRRAVMAGAAVLLGGCATSTADKGLVSVETDDSALQADKGAPPAPTPPIVWPLTGVATEEVAARPAMSIKIENSAAARPQTGLGQADVVWEEMVEGGITRYNAVFHSAIPEIVGPIRSLRPMDAAISGPFGGIFVFSGGQRRFVNQVAATGLTMLSHDGGAAGFYRSSDRRAPHNVYGKTATFLEAGAGTPPPPQFQFARTAEQATTVAGTAVSSISVQFPSSSPGWTWNGERWSRSEGGAEARTMDGGTITATNVVILRVQVRNSGAVDPAGSPVPETILTGTGDAIIATGGRTVTATWSKPDVTSVLALAVEGEPALLAPGNVWVELLPVSGSSVTIA